jgi:hypothetical protein
LQVDDQLEFGRLEHRQIGLGLCFKKFCLSVNYLTLGLRKNMQTPIGKLNAT